MITNRQWSMEWDCFCENLGSLNRELCNLIDFWNVVLIMGEGFGVIPPPPRWENFFNLLGFFEEKIRTLPKFSVQYKKISNPPLEKFLAMPLVQEHGQKFSKEVVKFFVRKKWWKDFQHVFLKILANWKIFLSRRKIYPFNPPWPRTCSDRKFRSNSKFRKKKTID